MNPGDRKETAVPEKTPSALSLALTYLRSAARWSMTRLARALLAAAVAFAESIGDARPLPKVRDRQAGHADTAAFLQAARARVAAAPS